MQTTLTALVFGLLPAAAAAQTVVFTDDFNTTTPTEVTPGAAALEGVQGYLGLGPAGNTFGGTFLRSPTGNVVTLNLANLPPHRAISLAFLFAAIDSLDGTGVYPAGDFFKVTLDGHTMFRESFANALPSQYQSYLPPTGVQLARRIDLGFSGPGSYYTDSAYDLGADPVFANLAHTATTATFTFEIEGPGIQSLGDESWAMDNLQVAVATTSIGSVAAYGTSCGPTLAANGGPGLGRQFQLTLTNLPVATLLASGAMGMSDTAYGSQMLPMPLASLGMPGCWLLQDLSLASYLPMALNGATASIALPVPNDQGLLGFQFYAQGWALAPGVNAIGAVFSNGLRIHVGQ